MAKPTQPDQAVNQVAQAPAFTVVGLEKSSRMPIHLNGQEYDLANLSPQDVVYLLAFPDQVPYLKPAAATVADAPVAASALTND